jgi:hypothetical protein
VKSRKDKKVAPFFELSYMAGLYDGTVLVFASNAADAAGVSDTEQRNIQNLL